MTNHKDFFNGHSHSCDQGLACIVGLEAAHVFNHIIYWLRINAKKESARIIDGKHWMYETQKEIAEFLGYLNEDQVCRAIKKLVDSGILIAENHNSNKFLKTNWYTVVDQELITGNPEIKKTPSIPQKCGIDTSNLRNPNRKFAESIICTKEEQIKKQTNNIKETDDELIFSDSEKESLKNFSSGQIKQAMQTTKENAKRSDNKSRVKYFFKVIQDLPKEKLKEAEKVSYADKMLDLQEQAKRLEVTGATYSVQCYAQFIILRTKIKGMWTEEKMTLNEESLKRLESFVKEHHCRGCNSQYD
jgi:hypothetical protein